jgi:hypothetical protein
MKPTPMSRQVRRMREHPSAVLLVSQLLAVLLYPFLSDAWLGRAVLGVVGMLVVGLALWAVRRTPALSLIAFSLGVPALVFTVLEAVLPNNESVGLTSALLHAPFYFYVSYGLIRYLFADARVTRDELFAIGATFTVVAWGFAYVYAAVQIIWPASFSGDGGTGDPHAWFELLYLSFTTLTSVGLSDIGPIGAHARAVVMLEELAGVMYVAMVVARLVGLTVIRGER